MPMDWYTYDALDSRIGIDENEMQKWTSPRWASAQGAQSAPNHATLN
jgi:hypothetical protein